MPTESDSGNLRAGPIAASPVQSTAKSPVVVLGMWVLFAPLALIAAFTIASLPAPGSLGLQNWVQLLMSSGGFLISVIALYFATRGSVTPRS